MLSENAFLFANNEWQVQMSPMDSSVQSPPRAAAVQKMVGQPTARGVRGKDKKQRYRKSKVELQREKLARLRDQATNGACSDAKLPAVIKGPNARLPANARQHSNINNNNNATPTRMPAASFADWFNSRVTRPRILPDEQRTAEMKALQETMPDRHWVRTDDVHFLQQLIDAKRERKAMEGEVPMVPKVPKNKTAARNKRRTLAKRYKAARQGVTQAVVIKTESIDGSPDLGCDSVHCGASKAPNRRAWTGPKTNSIIDIVGLCTYPGQTIKPSSFTRLFTLQQRIDAAVDGQGPLRNILRNLPRDITLTVERKEAIWVAQGKLNRIVDERRRVRRLQNIDRYLSSHRRIPIDRYVPGVPYNPIPHMLAMRVLSGAVA